MGIKMTLQHNASNFLNSAFAALSDSASPQFFIGGNAVDYRLGIAGKLYTLAMTSDGVAFAYTVITGKSVSEAVEAALVKPTAILQRGDELMIVWALSQTASRERIQHLAKVLDMDIDEEIPVPTADSDWLFPHLDSERIVPLAELEAAYLRTDNVPHIARKGERYHDAEVMRDYYRAQCAVIPFTLVECDNEEAKYFQSKTTSLDYVFAKLSSPREGKKSGEVFLPVTVMAGRRTDEAVTSINGMTFNVDDGTPDSEVIAKVDAAGVAAVVHTSYSHGKIKESFALSAIEKFANGREIDTALMREYTRVLKKWHPEIADSVIYEGKRREDNKWVCLVSMPPMSKCRIFFPFAKPFDINQKISKEGKTLAEVKAEWKALYDGYAKRLGFNYDASCLNFGRVYFCPRHPKGKKGKAWVWGGPLLDLSTIVPSSASTPKRESSVRKTSTPQGKALVPRLSPVIKRLQLADLVRDYAPEIRAESGEKVTPPCPFEEDHTEQSDSDTAFFVKNAGDGTGGNDMPVARCHHTSCHDKNAYDHIAKMMANEWFGDDELFGDNYLPQMLNEDGTEFCPTPDGPIDMGTASKNIDADTRKLSEKSTPADWMPILKKMVDCGMNGSLLDDKLDAISKATGRKNKGALRKDIEKLRGEKQQKERTAKEDVAETTAVNKSYWYAVEDDLVKALNAETAMVLRGEEERFLITQKNGNIVLMRRRDAETRFAKYKLMLAMDVGKEPKLVSGFRAWIESEKHREYDSVVFNPKVTATNSDELNLWTGFAAKPVKGDWSLMRAHIFENVCKGDQSAFDYLMAIIAQMFQEPWRKVGVAPVFRGKLGVGKSKVGQWLKKMVGMRFTLVVNKAEQWTGRFNGQLEYVILLCCEEGFFAGSHETRSSMKDIITDDTLAYERKGLELFHGPNFTHVIITSNEDWVVPAEPGERRYFVLDVGDKHQKDAKYFAAIDAQMEAGGAEAMLYDLMQLDISKVDFANPPFTDALKDQIHIGLSPQMKWLSSILASGCFPFKDTDKYTGVEWSSDKSTSVDIPKETVVASYRDFVPGFRGVPATPQDVGAFLAKSVPGLTEKKRKAEFGSGITRYWHFPPLEELRAAFMAANPGYAFPDEPECEPEQCGKPKGNKDETETPSASDKVVNLKSVRRD
jgi:hypothetical protein